MIFRTNTDADATAPRTPLPPVWLVGVCCLLPAAQTALSVYFEICPKLLYPLLKAVILGAPILVWVVWRRPWGRLKADLGLGRTNLLRGLASGAVLAAAILAAYYGFLRSMVDPAPLIHKARSLGILNYYWAAALFISLWNSLVEEYYWRAFLFDQFRARIACPVCLVVVGGFFFGLHHIFAFGGILPVGLTALAVLGTMAAGAVWSWQRLRGHSSWDCYVSHMMADLAGFWAGWDLIGRA